jgi:hypothetical protein
MEFPRLKTGVRAQYGSGTSRRFATRVLRFVDGGEQRFRKRGLGERRWLVRLTQLDEGELAALDAFFQAVQGPGGEFAFEDPRTGVLYPRCRLEREEMVAREAGRQEGAVEIEIVEVTD